MYYWRSNLQGDESESVLIIIIVGGYRLQGGARSCGEKTRVNTKGGYSKIPVYQLRKQYLMYFWTVAVISKNAIGLWE